MRRIAALVGVALAVTAWPAAAGEFNPEDGQGPLPAESVSSTDIVAAPAKDAPKTVRLTLRQAIATAIERNPLVGEARARLDEAAPLKALAVSGSLPQVSLLGTATYQKDPLGIGAPLFGGEAYNRYTAGLKFTQSLFAGWSLIPGIRVADHERRLRELDVAIAERDLGVQVLQSYFGVLLAQHQLRSLERNLETQEDLLKLTRHRQRIGRSQLLDVLQIETQKAQLAPQIQSARNSVRTQAARLAVLLGERDATEFRIPDGLVPVDASRLMDPARAARAPVPELERARLAREQFEDTRGVLLAKHWPSLDLVGSWGRQSYVKTDLFSENSTAWAVGFELNVPLFAGLSYLFERRQLAAQAAQREMQQAGALNVQALADVSRRETLKLAHSNLASYREAYRLAARSLAEARRAYRVATIDYQQYLTTQLAFFATELAFEQAKYQVIDAAAQYCVATGIPLSQLLDILAKGEISS